ncbi:MAG TPA: hypothetical protein DEH78_08080 [Solibacterales bacterium]|nr:hypothetical protein [Bryobacterales bacterium]
MKIRVIIDELVLHGFEGVDSYRVGDGVRTELARLVAGRFTTPPSAAEVRAPGIAPGTRDLGPRIAAAVHGGLVK